MRFQFFLKIVQEDAANVVPYSGAAEETKESVRCLAVKGRNSVFPVNLAQ